MVELLLNCTGLVLSVNGKIYIVNDCIMSIEKERV